MGVVLLALLLGSACGGSEFRYVSNASINTYLKVPSSWTVYTQDDLINAEIDAAQSSDQPASLLDVLINRRFQWRMAFDGDPQPSVAHTLGLAEEPVVEVSVRALDREEHDQVSLAALRNVIVNYDELKAEARAGLTGNGLVLSNEPTATFRPIDEEELHHPGGVRGVRLRYVLRPTPTSPFYGFDQTALVDAKAERLYVLLIRSGEAQFLRHNQLFTEIAKSFTVKAKG
jgi:hypothetical protein